MFLLLSELHRHAASLLLPSRSVRSAFHPRRQSNRATSLRPGAHFLARRFNADPVNMTDDLLGTSRRILVSLLCIQIFLWIRVEQLFVPLGHEVIAFAFINRLRGGGRINLHMAHGAEYVALRCNGFLRE